MKMHCHDTPDKTLRQVQHISLEDLQDLAIPDETSASSMHSKAC